MLKQVDTYLSNLKTHWFILIMVVASFLLLIPLNYLSHTAELNPIFLFPSFGQFVEGIFFEPFLETIIFQVGLFWILRYIPYIRKHDSLIILISAILFGLNHPFGIGYIIVATIYGLLFNYAYLIYQKKNKITHTLSAFAVVYLIYALHNMVCFFDVLISS